MTEAVVVITTVDSRAAATMIADCLVEERLAACVQVTGPVSSTYRSQQRIERADEWTCHIKTLRTVSREVMARVRAIHPYDTPEILVLPVLDGLPDYLRWIAAEVDAVS